MTNQYLPVAFYGGLTIGMGSYLIYLLYRHGGRLPNLAEVVAINLLGTIYLLSAQELGKSIGKLMLMIDQRGSE